MRSEALLLAAALLAPPAPAAVVERILAVVDGRPVLLSEVALFGKVRGEDLPRALEGLIDEELMYREAARLPQAGLSAEEEERAFQSLLARAGARPEEEEELRRVARRQGAILKYVEFRFRPQVRVSEEEVRAAYEREPWAGPRPSFEEAAPRLRARLADEDLTRRIEAWVKELRLGVDVRYNALPPRAAEGGS